jgi:hypothetical protein
VPGTALVTETLVTETLVTETLVTQMLVTAARAAGSQGRDLGVLHGASREDTSKRRTTHTGREAARIRAIARRARAIREIADAIRRIAAGM